MFWNDLDLEAEDEEVSVHEARPLCCHLKSFWNVIAEQQPMRGPLSFEHHG